MSSSVEEAPEQAWVPQLVAGVEPRKLLLDSDQLLVLSRVDGRRSINEIGRGLPFSVKRVIDIVRRFHAEGVLHVPGVLHPAQTSRPMHAPPSLPRPEGSPQRAGEPAPAGLGERARPASAAGPANGGTPIVRRWLAVPTTGRLPVVRRPVATPRPERPPSGAGPFVHQDEIETIDLTSEVRRRIDEMLALATRGDPRALLGVPRDADENTLRRAYFRLAKEFHPDRYFGRELGRYRSRLEALFGALTEAFRVLSDGAR
ncbi:MAG TPA: DnaJ domain-containing protein [Polyangia bacterium]|nr:DnaJ domain-containing protein [Polyangia bacterium]